MLTLTLLLVFLPQVINAQCKELVLDWGSYSATYDTTRQLCTFSNVRFARPPTGELRFQAPQTPVATDPPAPSSPVSCVQVDVQQPCTPSGDLFLVNSKCPKDPVGPLVEDCLFLDIYVPLSVLNGGSQVPVVVWFYGGAYVFGSKHQFDISKIPMYSGKGLLTATPDPLIFVAGNYRLGAFGWLAGSYMEKEALPNAGLYDQRMILKFVQNNIGKVNGDPKAVSAWGESAGASSILHHLVSKEGNQDPLFSKAVLQSPAFQWQWDRTGSLNDTYTRFAGFAGCQNGDIDCLQSASEAKLRDANQELFQTTTACQGVFPVGPSLDGQLLKTLPAVAFRTGKFWTKSITSMIISHVSDEVKYNGSFIPSPIRENPTAANFDAFLEVFMPGNEFASIRDEINTTYASTKFNDQLNRVGILIRDAAFTCNTRQLFDAYSSKIPTWMMNYHFLAKYDAAVHASDLLPTFCNNDLNVADLLSNCAHVPVADAGKIGPYIRKIFAPEYQSYLKSHAIHGDPNKGAQGGAKKVNWPVATTGTADNYTHVMNVMQPYYPGLIGPPFKILSQDPNNTATSCEFWNHIASEIMGIVGKHQQESSLVIQDVESLPEDELKH